MTSSPTNPSDPIANLPDEMIQTAAKHVQDILALAIMHSSEHQALVIADHAVSYTHLTLPTKRIV